MQVIRETLLEGAGGARGSRPTYIIDICTDELLEQLQKIAAVSKPIISNLVRVLSTLKTKYAKNEDVVLNLNMSELKYSLSLWEEALFIATQQVAIPQEVYITVQGKVNRTVYCEDNRVLDKFISALGNDEQLAVKHNFEPDYELLLKKSIMIIMHKHNITEHQLEKLLAKTHDLGKLIDQCEAHST